MKERQIIEYEYTCLHFTLNKFQRGTSLLFR